MIRVKALSAGYVKGIDVLQGVALEVNRAEIVTLLGPNGCGKSTLLKCIAGYFFPRQGVIELEGDDASRQPMHLKARGGALGFVPQTDNVFTALSVRENLLVGGQFLPPRQCQARLAALCALYPVLGRKLHLRAAALSGGERQILALARALMPGPRTLLLDEPSAGLSPKMLHEVFAAIEHTRQQEQVAILMVEQNAVEALRISDRAYVLAQGKVAMSGAAAELLHDARMRELYLGGRAA
ncbi:ATP-binding cassette domain-containing protein [Pseudomonas sp. NPDC007930]|uniref:ABC transporter ATP-binding protein n=1 Tax=Pseudomonas sp. NPDC007930 TaxID=3364417 RepID=UPI0036ED1BDF